MCAWEARLMKIQNLMVECGRSLSEPTFARLADYQDKCGVPKGMDSLHPIVVNLRKMNPFFIEVRRGEACLNRG